LLDTHASEPHNLLMRKVIANASNQWELLKTFPYRQSAAGRQFQLYRRSGPFVHLERPLAVDLSYTLGRAVKLSLP